MIRENTNKKKTLVMGGAGFVGHHIVNLLRQKGRSVFVADVKDPCNASMPEGVVYYDVSGVTDYGFTVPELNDDYDEIIDLVYNSVPQVSYQNPISDITENLPRFINMLQFAEKRCKEKFVFFSSGGTVYGQAKYLPITEDHPLEPISPYGITKLASEKYAAMYGLQHDVPIICLRPGNIYGEGQMPFRGQGFVATAIGSVLKSCPISIFGDAGVVRDYIYAEDAARAVLAALEDGVPGKIYNVGTGQGLTNAQILKYLEGILPEKYKMPGIEYFPERQFDVLENILDSAQLKADTDWEPKISFEEGLKRSFSWLEQNFSVLYG